MSKEIILQNVRRSKPDWSIELPDIPPYRAPITDLVTGFTDRLTANKATVINAKTGDSLKELLQEQYPNAVRICSTIPEVEGTVSREALAAAVKQGEIDLAVVRGEIGVADNGAIWISDRTLPMRAIPFITRYLAVAIETSALVPKMHQAYHAIDFEGLGFGVFISGPSKTADIEQALVVGAHGPLGLTVILQGE